MTTPRQHLSSTILQHNAATKNALNYHEALTKVLNNTQKHTIPRYHVTL